MKKRLLLPLDGSDRDLIALNYVRHNFNPKETDVVLLNVGEIVFINGIVVPEILTENKNSGNDILNKAYIELSEFNCEKEFAFGYVDKEILDCAQIKNIDAIVMSKNTKKKFVAIVGSVTAKVIKKAKCTVIVLPQS